MPCVRASGKQRLLSHVVSTDWFLDAFLNLQRTSVSFVMSLLTQHASCMLSK